MNEIPHDHFTMRSWYTLVTSCFLFLIMTSQSLLVTWSGTTFGITLKKVLFEGSKVELLDHGLCILYSQGIYMIFYNASIILKLETPQVSTIFPEIAIYQVLSIVLVSPIIDFKERRGFISLSTFLPIYWIIGLQNTDPFGPWSGHEDLGHPGPEGQLLSIVSYLVQFPSMPHRYHFLCVIMRTFWGTLV